MTLVGPSWSVVWSGRLLAWVERAAPDRTAPHRTEGATVAMMNVDLGGGDRLALAQYRMATTEQMHLVIAPGVRIEQTRRRLTKLREEGLVDRVTLP
ncbi:replication-relaxation family protein [Streptomyces sp. HUAS TT20]|uniref:replication-relaxation family protein n=1 Tax=Streptomyces sp. HUAS TT20 TaxID=3447509 RepID=UPI0021DA6407|nr:replication-relaxation family protein [Streptomyces sp. HUAS 15-9]UXY32412.1 replication-relaxation family protein [Streptomyces sp. HUAS 15-9]